MKIAKVIEKADKWQPNVFGLADKLDWCYEVTRDLLNDNPEFGSVLRTVSHDGAVVPLPEGVVFSDVSECFINGKRVERLDERTMQDADLKRGDSVYIVYRLHPSPYALEKDENSNLVVPEELETIVSAPFDAMYIHYVCAQIAFWQNDADEYNKFISAYNTLFYAYKNICGAQSPIGVRKQFVNYF